MSSRTWSRRKARAALVGGWIGLGWAALNIALLVGWASILPTKDLTLIRALLVWGLVVLVLGLWLIWRGNRRLMELVKHPSELSSAEPDRPQ